MMVLTVVVVAASAGVVSFSHIYGLVLKAGGEPRPIAILVPISIDGILLTSSLTLLFCSRYSVPKPSLARWGQFLGISLTLTANIAHGLAYSPAAAALGAWPAVSLIFSSELLWWVVETSRAMDKREIVVYESQPANTGLQEVVELVANNRDISGREIARKTGLAYPKALELNREARRLLNGSS